MLTKLVCYILGFISGMSFVIVISRVIISSEESRRKAPTVNVIPVEWIEKKAQKFLMNRNFRWATDFQEVVDMWKVENNIPLFDGELKITLEKENEENETDH